LYSPPDINQLKKDETGRICKNEKDSTWGTYIYEMGK
jgi:hypothetical protein